MRRWSGEDENLTYKRQDRNKIHLFSLDKWRNLVKRNAASVASREDLFHMSFNLPLSLSIFVQPTALHHYLAKQNVKAHASEESRIQGRNAEQGGTMMFKCLNIKGNFILGRPEQHTVKCKECEQNAMMWPFNVKAALKIINRSHSRSYRGKLVMCTMLLLLYFESNSRASMLQRNISAVI